MRALMHLREKKRGEERRGEERRGEERRGEERRRTGTYGVNTPEFRLWK
jgi:hypothetical protein